MLIQEINDKVLNMLLKNFQKIQLKVEHHFKIQIMIFT